jgi:hypothetical protein
MPAEEVIKILKENGISETISKRMLRNSTLFIRYKRENAGKGLHYGYIWPSTPIHINLVRNFLYPPVEEKKTISSKKDMSFEEECAEYLRKQGYQLKKCIGFDEDTFKKDYPQIWKKYLIYEEV